MRLFKSAGDRELPPCVIFENTIFFYKPGFCDDALKVEEFMSAGGVVIFVNIAIKENEKLIELGWQRRVSTNGEIILSAESRQFSLSKLPQLHESFDIFSAFKVSPKKTFIFSVSNELTDIFQRSGKELAGIERVYLENKGLLNTKNIEHFHEGISRALKVRGKKITLIVSIDLDETALSRCHKTNEVFFNPELLKYLSDLNQFCLDFKSTICFVVTTSRPFVNGEDSYTCRGDTEYPEETPRNIVQLIHKMNEVGIAIEELRVFHADSMQKHARLTQEFPQSKDNSRILVHFDDSPSVIDSFRGKGSTGEFCVQIIDPYAESVRGFKWKMRQLAMKNTTQQSAPKL